jgi:hypothetical protein
MARWEDEDGYSVQDQARKRAKEYEHENESEILGRLTLPAQARPLLLAPDPSWFPLFHISHNGVPGAEGIEKELSPRGHNSGGDQEGHERHDA